MIGAFMRLALVAPILIRSWSPVGFRVSTGDSRGSNFSVYDRDFQFSRSSRVKFSVPLPR